LRPKGRFNLGYGCRRVARPRDGRRRPAR
jgi:hypothetical protein